MIRPRTGIDVISVDRLRTALGRRPRLLTRVFTPGEIADATRDDVDLGSTVAVRRLAARFAAKEAARKCLGGPTRWRDAEVRTDADGAPVLWIRGAPSRAALSLSHDGDLAVALVVTLDETLPEVPDAAQR